MHELSVLVATLGEYVIKPLVWPIVFISVIKGALALMSDDKNGDRAQ